MKNPPIFFTSYLPSYIVWTQSWWGGSDRQTTHNFFPHQFLSSILSLSILQHQHSFHFLPSPKCIHHHHHHFVGQPLLLSNTHIMQNFHILNLYVPFTSLPPCPMPLASKIYIHHMPHALQSPLYPYALNSQNPTPIHLCQYAPFLFNHHYHPPQVIFPAGPHSSPQFHGHTSPWMTILEGPCQEIWSRLRGRNP